MADKLYKLSEEDIAVIQAMKAQLNGVAGNPRLRRPPRTDDFQTNEIYIAKAPDGGIAALSGTTPGSAQCQVYQLIGGELVAVTPVKTVYNVTSEAIPDNAFFPTVKDKWGSWFAVQGTGGSSPAAFSGASIFNNSTQSIPSGSPTPVAWGSGSPAFDTDGYFSAANDYLTIPFTGAYSIGTRATWPTNTGISNLSLTLVINLTASFYTAYGVGPPIGYAGLTQYISQPINLNAGDKVGVQVFQDSGTSLNMSRDNLFALFLGDV